ncbi:MAG: sugar ABC transporter permease [Oscillospiraceae bacterium]|nr:sugar ABC transporter permease [Oscillospiraceae bacterium]
MLFSLLFMGLGHIVIFKQYIRGAMYALCQVIFLLFLPTIVNNLIGIVTLGFPQPDLHILERDNSMFMLMDGVLTLAFLGLFIGAYVLSVKSALKLHRQYETTGLMPAKRGVLEQMGTGAFPVISLLPATVLILFFILVPLIFSASVAFTNYSMPHNIPPGNTVDWVGFDNFRAIFGGDAAWTGALGRVVLWTLAWASLATLTCYAGGFILAVILKNANFKIGKIFRPILILPYAIPAIVSFLVWQNMLNGAFGVVNRTLIELGLITQGIPWLTDLWLARFMVVAINLWAGFPYFMLLTTGAMTAISKDVLEAARIDGASQMQMTRRITLPLVLYQTLPLIIMSFTHNINNFGVIFFLSGGNPAMPDTVATGAGGTDILISWIFNLTINFQHYHYAAVLATTVFVALAPFAIFNFMRTKSFKEGEL